MTDLALLQDFLAETSEHLEEMERNLLLLEDDAHSKELLDDIFRSIHTIKGSSDYLGMGRIAELSHRLENLLDLMRQEKRSADRDTVDLLIDGRDRIASLIGDLEQTQAESTGIDDLLARLDAAVVHEPAETTDSQAAETVPSGAQTELSPIENEGDEELLAIFLDQFEAGVQGLRRGLDEGESLSSDHIDAALRQLASLQASANYMGYTALCDLYDPWETELEDLRSKAVQGEGAALSTEAYWRNYLKPHLVTLLALIPARARDLTPYLEDPVFQAQAGEDPAGDDTNDADADAQLFSDVCLDDLLEEPECTGDPATGSATTDLSSEEPQLSLEPEDDPLIPETVVPEVDAADADAPPASDAAPVDEALLADFFEEAQEHLEEMEGNLLKLAQAPDHPDLLNDIFRCVHTIKGSADYIGLAGITELSHQFENFLDHLRQGHRPMDDEVMAILMAAGDQIQGMIAELAEGGRQEPASEDLLLRLAAASEPVAGGAHPPQDGEPEAPAPGAASHADVPAASVNYIEENDEELLEIFLGQLREELAALIDLANHEDLLSAANLAQCRKKLENLSASANYMGYGELQQAYDDWERDLEETGAAIGEGATIQSQAWLQESVLPFVKLVASFFPQAENLTDLWKALTLPEAAMESGAPHSPTMASTDPELLAQLGSAFDAMLETPPAAEAHVPQGIEGELFSAVDTDAADEESQKDLPDTEGGGPEPTAQLPEVAPDADAGDRSEGVDAPTAAAESEPFSPVTAPPSTSRPSGTEAVGEDVEAKGSPATAVEAPRQNAAAKRMLRQSIRVDAGKIDTLMNQVGELVVNRAFFSQLCNEMRELQHYLKQSKHLDKREFKQVSGLTFRIGEATVALGRVANELQEGVMRVRMLPIAQLFNRYPRLVHDLARSSGKKVALQLRGEDTELDKMVIERIADPLIHIIRNAVDHGLEIAEERRRKGKSETGKLVLSAYHESNHVVIEIEDDGRGVDLERIKAKAIEKGLIGESTASQLSDREIINLILIPGFSTADTITHTSGRGVGMDVVKKNIEKLNGTLEVDTTPGLSTRIRIKIPLTLAIIPALLVRVTDELFTIPLSVVDETLRVFKDEISVIEGVDVMYLRDETIPLIRLRDVFNMDTRSEIAEKSFVVIVNTGQRRVGLIVDHMLGQEEVVIKPLEDYLQENSGFSGATILGDGQISLILDVYELIKLSTHKQARRQTFQPPL